MQKQPTARNRLKASQKKIKNKKMKSIQKKQANLNKLIAFCQQ